MRFVVAFVVVLLLTTTGALADDPESAVALDGLSTLWVLLAAFLVFFMQAGFGMLEAGLIRAENASNVLM